ncbi:MAG: VTT domain-containing protein [Nanoarchaeota archaeon]
MYKTKIKKFVREASIPLVFLVLYYFLFHFQKFISLPTQDKFMDLILNFMNTQNIFLIFLIALVEGGLILGQYSPGGIVIFLSIMSAEGNIPKMILLLSVISLAYLLAYSLDYLFGYYVVETVIKKLGFEKKVERYRKLLDKNVFSTIFFSYAETNIASLVAVSSGLLKIPFKKFIYFSVISVIFWNTFWAVVLYFFGNAILSIFGTTYLVIILAIWVLIVFYNNFLKKEETINVSS